MANVIMYVRDERGKRHRWTRDANSAGFVDVVEETQKALEVSLLIVDVGEVAAVRAVVVATIGQLMGHRFQVGRVHGVVCGTHDQGGDVDPW